MSFELEDWGNIALVCPCKTHLLADVDNIRDFREKCMKMDSSRRQIEFICDECRNSFDYDVKIRLFELLKEHLQENHTCDGFIKYISRKGQRIRVRFIKVLNQTSTKNEHGIIIIEAANLTKCPQFKMN